MANPHLTIQPDVLISVANPEVAGQAQYTLADSVKATGIKSEFWFVTAGAPPSLLKHKDDFATYVLQHDSILVLAIVYQMQILNRQPSQETLQRLATKCSYAPALLINPELQDICPLKEVERRLAQKYGMTSSQGIDSVAVLQEARRHRKLPWRRFHSILLAFLRKVSKSVSNGDDLSVPLESPTLVRSAPYPVDASRFWAVLIGIDAYESNPLHGCVSDALSMKKFIIDIGTPEHHIHYLLGSRKPYPDDPLTPSRANIVNMLHSLIDNPEIE
ncbi:uncharacterized protein ARMOST_20796 [Armillaria ostoyae]|uniref:Uncharacterized protein n=1 Tax=Armillaria ostoyae TaxID=47428 RepID=A0A284S8F7_ARMOS|nr:uncharacterized protein ARMOST_20796 [Armillaria ostoyae]